METLTLYRGDYTKIDEFRFNKTNRSCYVGPGVYLTSKREVANTYRYKGSGTSAPSPALYAGPAKNRSEAYALGFKQFHLRFLQKQDPPTNGSLEKRLKACEAAARERYNYLIELGAIKAEYYSIHFAKHIRVSFNEKVEVGFVTEFRFPKLPLERSVLRLDRPINDPTFWEIIFDKQVKFGAPSTHRDQFIHQNLRFCADDPNKCPHRQIRHAVQPYGYTGFEYEGGLAIGGFGRHRAFCLWDDDFVNAHKVRQHV